MSHAEGPTSVGEGDATPPMATHTAENTSQSTLQHLSVARSAFGYSQQTINLEGINNVGTKLRGRSEEEVLAEYKVEESKKGAYKGRGEPLSRPESQEISTSEVE